MNYEIFLAIGMFTAIVLALVVIILMARAKLVSSGDVSIEINGEPAEKMPTHKLVDVSPMALRMSSPFNAGYWLSAT